jgi:hypothetical protein
MAWTTPSTRSTGFKVTAAIYNNELIENLLYLKNAPTFDGVVTITAGTASAPALTKSGDSNTGLFFPAADSVALTAGGVSTLRVTPTAVGVGVTPKTWGAGFSVLEFQAGAVYANSPLFMYLTQGLYSDGTDIRYQKTDDASSGLLRLSGGEILFSNAPAGNADAVATLTTRLVVEQTGTIRPGSNDGAALGTNSVSWSDLYLASGAVISIANADVTMTHSANTLTFAGASSGYVFSGSGISVNNTGVVTSGFIDFLKGASWDTLGYVDGTSSVAIGGYRSSQWNEIRFYNSGTEYMRLSGQELWIGYTTDQGAYRLQVNSQIFATNATIATSDARFKTDVQPVADGLAAVRALKPVAFRWKPHPIHNFIAGTDVGFLAQDVQQALAGRAYANTVVTANGTGKDEFLGMADAKLIPLLVAAVQELATRVDALKARVH